jgi:signal transduction histidine kinase/ActR/RegA family two-component response regulator
MPGEKNPEPTEAPDSSQVERDQLLFSELTRLNSQLVNTQRALTKNNQDLERLNQVKNQFLGMASHDLRSPLAAILGYSEFLLEDAAAVLSREQLEYLDVIHASSEFMLALVNDLLDIATIESGRLQLERSTTHLAALIINNLALNRQIAAAKQISLNLIQDNEIPPLYIDDNRIEQVINNLVSNAIKYSHSGTTVHVHVHLHQQDDEVVVSVADQGQGIPAHELDQLFRPFGTTSIRSTSGEKSTGLGLLIARRVLEAHNGRIWVESTLGTGSTFYFALPVVQAVSADPSRNNPLSPAAHPSQTGSGAQLRVLVVEDNIINQRIITKLLEQAGIQADTAPNGAVALDALRIRPYDLILMDIYMPEMDGIEATKQVREEVPPEYQPYIAAMTASLLEEDRQRALAAGADAFMSKPTPSRKDELMQVLEAARQQKQRNA